MATLFNTKISATYQGLFKTIDNAVLSASLRELTDGAGNQSGLFLNTAGDFKVTSVLEWGSLKDTGTGVTITQFVTAANGIENFNNDTTLPTSAAVKLYVDTKFSQTDTLTEVLGFGNTTSGKDIAVSAGDDITFTDTSKAIFGAGSDLQIYHSGSDSFIENTGGDLKVTSTNIRFLKTGLGEFIANFFADGANEFFFDGTKRIETLGDGAKVTGNLVVTGSITGAGGSFLPLAGGTMTGNTLHGDNIKSIYGASSDFEIFHNSTTNSNVIQSNASRQLAVQQDNLFIGNQTATEIMITAIADGAVSLYFNGSKKFETTNTGVGVTGALSTTTDVAVGANATFVDNGKAIFGAGSDLQIFHDGSDSFIQNTGGDLKVSSNIITFQKPGLTEFMANFNADGANEFFFDGSKKIETVTDGAKITGNLVVTGNITANGGGSFLRLDGGTMTGNTIHNDNVKSIYGTASDGLQIFHNGSDSFILDSGTGDLYVEASTNFFVRNSDNGEVWIKATDNGVSLRFQDSQKLITTNTGISVTGVVVADGLDLGNNEKIRLGATGEGLRIFHDGNDSRIVNGVGGLYIDNTAVTQAIFFRVSNSSALDTTALTINRVGDLITGNDVTIAGNLTVNGTTTTVNSQTLSVVDPLISLATANTANSLDIGFYGKYNDSTNRYLGLFNDASDSNKFKLFRGTTVEPTTTVNIAGAGYVAADLVVAGLESNNIIVSNASTAKISVIDTTNTATLSMFARDSDGNIGTESNHKMVFNTNNTKRLELDAAGSYLVPGANGTMDLGTTTTKWKDLFLSGSIVSAGATFTSSGTPLTLNRTDGNTALIQQVISGTTRGFIGATDTKCFEVYNDSAASKFSILNGGDATFAGNVDVNGTQITVGTNASIFAENNLTFKSTAAAFIDHNTVAQSIKFRLSNSSSLDVTPFEITPSYLSSTVDMYFGDNDKIRLGNSSDLQIKHDGNNSKITESGTGGLYIGSNLLGIQNGSHNETMAVFTADGSVDLYYNNVKKFETTSIGISVTGSINAEGLQVSSNITTPLIQLKGDLNVLNKAQTSYLTLADRDTSGSEVVYNLANVGSATFANAVGIGTTSPNEQLEVAGTDTGIIVNGTTSSRIYYNRSGTYTWSTGLRSGDTKFHIFDERSGDRFIINDNGNVGIGETSIDARLHISSLTSSGISNVKLESAGSSKWAFGIPASQTYFALDDVNDNLTTPKLVVLKTSGNVGVGTTSPQGPLHVKGSTDDTVVYVDSDNNAIGDSASISFNGSRAKVGWLDAAVTLTDGGSNKDISLKVATGSIFLKTSNTTRMTVDAAGNVGVGTTAPASLLHIKGETKAYITFEDTTDGTLGFVGDAAQMLTSGSTDNLGLRGEGGIEFGVSDVIKMRLKSDGIVEITNGIKLGGTAAANLLNDYEEGTWTPALGGTWTTDPTNIEGTYTKIGNLVSIRLYFIGGAKSSATSGYFTGLPFATDGPGTGSVTDSGVADRGNCLFANTDRVWLTSTGFGSGTNYVSGQYRTNA